MLATLSQRSVGVCVKFGRVTLIGSVWTRSLALRAEGLSLLLAH